MIEKPITKPVSFEVIAIGDSPGGGARRAIFEHFLLPEDSPVQVGWRMVILPDASVSMLSPEEYAPFVNVITSGASDESRRVGQYYCCDIAIDVCSKAMKAMEDFDGKYQKG
jgi:hypothetical protein